MIVIPKRVVRTKFDISVFYLLDNDRGFEPRSGQTKDYKIDICCFGAKHTAFGSKSKDWLGRNQDNASTCTRFVLLNIIINRIQEIKVSYVYKFESFLKLNYSRILVLYMIQYSYSGTLIGTAIIF
jgi:hypothetical protein